MAEFAAVGVAASILQVIDFGTRFIATAWQLNKSEHTFLTSLDELRKTLENFRDAQRTLRSTNPGPNMAIDSLVQTSVAISEELMSSLDKLSRGRSSMKKAWIALRKEEKLKTLEVRLREVQLDLTFHMTVDLRSVVRDSAEKQDQILRQLRKTGLNVSRDEAESEVASAGYGGSVVECLTDGLPLHDKIKSELIGDLVANIYSLEEEHSTLSDASSIQISDTRRNKLEQLFISRLCYDTMQERELTIKDAHKGTFRWIFEDDDITGFKNWLTSDENLYWITGKPGSGKSTLMRYLLQPVSQDLHGKNGSTAGSMSPESTVLPHGRCEQYLKQWAGNGDELTVVSFHFWAIGSKLQSSQEGLLRTLLVQLLRAHPEIIPLVAPLSWESLCLFNLDLKSIGQIELGDMFQQAIVHISTRAKLAMFIDGLDEFDGNCYDLISLLQLCVKSPIKICVSSRPWVEFEGAFGDCPRLKMEDLTRQDISNYVVAKFGANIQFKSLQRRQARVAKDLVKSIVKKSSGVFLWVTIVVASLLAGIGAGDRVEDLQKRLGLLPAEIKNLYERILETIDSEYREHTAQLLKLMTAFKTQPSPLLFWYADEVNFMDRVIKEDPINVSRSESLERVEDIRRRLNSRCKGLLEIHKSRATPDPFSSRFEGTVGYLHKTVYEFIRSHRNQRRLRKYLKKPYDANLRIAAAYAAFAKGIASRREDVLDEDTLVACLYHASNVSLDPTKQIVRLLDHLTSVGATIPHNIWRLANATRPSANSRPPTNSWAYQLFCLEDNGYLEITDKMLCLATSMSVAEYVKARAKPGGYVVVQEPEFRRLQGGLAQLAERMVYKSFGYKTAWKVSLLSLLCFSDPNSAPILEHLLSKGAKPNMKNPRPRRLGSGYAGIQMTLWERILMSILTKGANDMIRTTPWEELLAEAFRYCIEYEEDNKNKDNVLRCVRQMVDAGAKINLKTVKKANKNASLRIDEEEAYRCLKRMKANPDAQFEVVEKEYPSARLLYTPSTTSSSI